MKKNIVLLVLFVVFTIVTIAGCVFTDDYGGIWEFGPTPVVCVPDNPQFPNCH